MFKTLVPYDQGQELALKNLWIVLQVTSNVVHDAFLILYSHLDNTEGGEKSIYQYCVENNKMFVYTELLDDGYAKELFEGSPKNAKHFDLKITRMLTESLIINKYEGGSMSRVIRIMKDFNYLRNELCHLELQSLRVRTFKMKLQGHWEALKILYKLVCELTGRTFSSHITKDLDYTMSSLLSSIDTKDSKCWNCTGRDEIRKGSRTRGTSQSSVDSGYFEPNQPTKHSAKAASGSPKHTNTKRIMKEKWVQTLPPRKLTMKNAYTQVEVNEKDISKIVGVPPKNETKSAMTQVEPSKDVHKNMNFTLNKSIPSTSSNLGEIRSHKRSMKGTPLYKDLNKTSTTGVLTGDHQNGAELPCIAKDSLKTHSNSSAGSEEKCFTHKRMNFPQHGTNSENTSTTPASGMGKSYNCASFKHSDMDAELLPNSTGSTSFTSRKVNRSNKCTFSEHDKDAELKEATTSDQHKCSCRDGSASHKDATDVHGILVNILQALYIYAVSCLIFCINVLVVCIYDLVDKVKRDCHIRWCKNSVRIIIDVKTGLYRVAHIVHVQGNRLVLMYHDNLPIRVIHMIHHDHHLPPNLPRPHRFGRKRR